MPGHYPYTPEQIDTRLDVVEDAAADVEAKLRLGVEDVITRLEAIKAQLEGATLGAVEVKLGQQEAQAHKILRKQLGQVTRHLDNAYTYAYPFGAINPTDEQVAYALQTGDYAGGLGIGGPIDLPSPVLPVVDPGDPQPPFEPPPMPPPGGGGPPPPPLNPPPAGCRPAGDWTPDANGIIWPDCNGQCPPGMRPNPGTGTFDNRCVPDLWGGGGGSPPPPPPGQVCPPCPMNIRDSHDLAEFGQRDGYFYHDPFVSAPPPVVADQFQQWTVTCGLSGGGVNQTMTVWVHVGWRLYINRNGELIAASAYSPTLAPWPASCGMPVGPPPPPPGEPPPGPGDGTYCRVPDPMPCGPELEFKPAQLTEIRENICKALADVVQSFTIEGRETKDLIGMVSTGDKVGSTVEAIMKAVLGNSQPIIPNLVNRFGNWLSATGKKLAEKIDCDVASAGPIATYTGLLRFIDQWFAIVPQQYMEFYQQAQNTACQSHLPTGSQADSAYLGDAIDKAVWECWHKANGNHLKQAEAVRDSQRTRPNPAQVAQLFRRKRIGEKEYDDRQRANGIITEGDKKAVFDTTEAWPGLEDVIRMMVRDVADPNIVQRFLLDEDFDAKWQGELVKYGDGLGVTKELAKDYWRAHWRNVSPTQLFECMHRLRPGRVPKGIEVTADDVKTALKQDDVMPFWVDRIMATSYRVITRTDATKAFEVHSIEKEDLQGIIEDEGYTAADAAILADYYEKRRKVNEVKRSGLPTARTLINQYARGELATAEFVAVANAISISEEQAGEMIQSAELARTVSNRKCAIGGIKKQYVTGLMDDGTATEQLTDEGVDAEEIEELLLCWRRHRKNAGKMPSTEKLCKWYGMGIITRQQYAQALVRIGWDQSMVTYIIRECETDLGEKQRKAAERAARQAQADQEKAEKREAKRLADLEKKRKEQQAAANQPPAG